MNSKSVKINEYVLNGSGLQHVRENRWFKVYRFDETDPSAGFVLEAGYEYQPADYREEHTNLSDLVASMRETADLRRWTAAQW